MVAQQTSNLKVVGSSPTLVAIFYDFQIQNNQKMTTLQKLKQQQFLIKKQIQPNQLQKNNKQLMPKNL
ncbi:hypothetical protein TTHERM_00129160 (macronuclear) [Tetrahymena thermophila SB210]|uniref:Uncharacterized protein n=1 Tax=Tetrahymena thermophila (strain SB210) TaxID=312017 RepID=I7MJB2_TETTS|nr:hypothetical protein TTHERM_00129160 [Tetrahymena thermophila SB210]EAR96146.1 hypothetical protein TTHERM_00129160 [Tetrahymena thermophila SB210]|eukprot:XP_001016391.1 hypothetical protein TTHERM_00129160 [Tetrahymena thermophila SB210]